MYNQILNTSPIPNAAADTPQQTPTISPDALIEQLRSLNGQIPSVTPMTAAERQNVRNRTRSSNNVVQASISIVGAADLVSQAIGHQADDVQALCDEAMHWQRVEDELRAMLNGVSGANLIRRQRLSALADRAYGIGSQLARDPEHSALVPHVEEVKRLKKVERRKKPAPAPQTPAPGTTAPAPQSKGA
jgi:hypothetical protein